jgi:plastocyanin domain-containing protein
MTNLFAADLINAIPLRRTIEWPMALNALVTTIGVGLIAWELWWFLGRLGSGVAAREGEVGLQVITITVDGGYAPSTIQVKVGKPLRLSFHRIDPSGCVARVIFPDFHKTLDLPLNANTSLELPATKSGIYSFHCVMNMVPGVVEVVDQSTTSDSECWQSSL